MSKESEVFLKELKAVVEADHKDLILELKDSFKKELEIHQANDKVVYQKISNGVIHIEKEITSIKEKMEEYSSIVIKNKDDIIRLKEKALSEEKSRIIADSNIEKKIDGAIDLQNKRIGWGIGIFALIVSALSYFTSK